MKKNFFLEHPVFSIVLSIVIFIIGIIGLVMLPVDQYPQIVPPVVKITASYPGADAMTVTQAVATPIEQELNGTPGMIYMSSSSSNSGGFSALVTFDIDVDPELAAVDIQNRIKKAESRLPAEVVQNGISVSKETASKLMTITILSDDPKFDEVYLSNYTTLNVIDPIRRIPGVGSVGNVGSRYYAMQIWVQPDKLANLGLTVKDIQNALKDQNRESAAGTLGQAPTTDIDVTMPIIARGRLSSVKEFEDIVLRTAPNGSLIRLSDVARVSLEASSYSTESGINGGNAAVININMLPGSNAMEVAEAVKAEMETISKNFPAGISYSIPFDMTTYIKESIHHVYRTFFEALLLVIAVVFLSLQNWRATLIPVIAVPISLVGTFGVMLIFGFSLNMLTLLGLILAIGIVVDDAIVVVENVDRIMNSEKLSPYEATAKAMKNLGSALIAMSLVLCAVFVPVSFLPGITGQLYRQFSVTIAVSVVISTIVALTLSPVMCAKLLKPASHKKKAKIFRLINLWLGKGNRFYGRAIARTLVHPKRMYAAFGLALVFIYIMNAFMPTSFMSQEDQGYFTVELELPEGATIERTREVTDRAMEFLMADPDVEYVLNVTGSSPRVGSNQAHSQLTVILKPWEERSSSDISEVKERIHETLASYPECKVYMFSPAIIPGLGSSGGFEMVLEARADATYSDLQNAVDTLRHYAASCRAIADLSTSMQADIPQLYFDVDRDRAKMLGIPVSDIFSTMKAFTGSIYVNDFNMFNRIYRVYIQADAPYRSHRENIDLFFVKSADGTMVPVSSLGNSNFTTGPGTIGRFNMFNSATISGEAAHGYSTGEAMEALENIVREHLPDNIGVEWSGLSYQQKHESGNTGLVLGLVFLFVFLFLAALYESWSVPLAVILSLPIAGVGAYLGIWLCGLENNIYFQIGLVMLVGLVAKNAILIVEFAKEETDKGTDPVHAALTAARLRFRPIVMTSLAFMLGLVPLLIASGPGSAARRDIGTGVFFGMAVAITVGIVFVPFFFVAVNKLFRKKNQ
jgi:RND transporter, HAE1 family